MYWVHHNLKTLPFKLLNNNHSKAKRWFGKQIEINSKNVRQSFVDYFVKKNGHAFIRSSPVVPFYDPSVAFVNAGMNQFKNVFLGQIPPPCKRAVNSQKCIRVGGKHNDLDSVGSDSFHHTFFEMLGNWSFGDYFKKEACEMAWNLLTGPYGIPPQRLYVTYFGGDIASKMPPDLETQEIWRSIGVPLERILPFGLAENFWEMGPTGPCGPCTEIHVDCAMDRELALDRVNRGHPDVKELWNVVFIQYNRLEDGTLTQLPTCHVDTGMGLERLVAFLLGRESNYDTDLFVPLFEAIQKKSKRVRAYEGLFGAEDKEGVDTAYRILADHARMVTVALSDGMFPDANHKLRRILRRALFVSQDVFGVESGMLQELSYHVGESLGEFYPEIRAKLPQTQLIMEHEEQLLRDLRKGAAYDWSRLVSARPELGDFDAVKMPGLVKGYIELQNFVNSNKPRPDGSTGVASSDPETKGKTETGPHDKPPAAVNARVEATHVKALNENIKLPDPATGQRVTEKAAAALPGDLAFKLYDTFGLDANTISRLAALERLGLDVNGLAERLDDSKSRSRHLTSLANTTEEKGRLLAELQKLRTPATDDSFKYNYSKDRKYVFPEVDCTVLVLLKDGALVKNVSSRKEKVECAMLLDRSNFYTESGGQACDSGWLRLENGADFKVEEAHKIGGYVLHHGYIEGGDMRVGDSGSLELDVEARLSNMRNHTATHLINAALRTMLTVTAQKSSRVSSAGLTFDFTVYGEKFTADDVERLESTVNRCIRARVDVKGRAVSADELLAMDDVTLLPGEVYPEKGIRLVEIVSDGILTSKEACCGTHVLNTSDLDEFCVLSFRNLGSGVRSIRAITGPQARIVTRSGRKMQNKITQMENKVELFLCPEGSESNDGEALGSRLLELKKDLAGSEPTLPFHVRQRSGATLDTLLQRLKEGARSALRESIESEMTAILGSNQRPYLVHFLGSSSTLDSVPLQKATRLCNHLPVLLLSHSEGMLKARCCVPKTHCSPSFNAQLWMQQVLSIFKASGSPPKGQDPMQVFNMRPRKVPDKEVSELIVKAVDRASQFASSRLPARDEAPSQQRSWPREPDKSAADT